MANLTETREWDGTYQFEEDDFISGGPDGLANLQGRQLGNRTRYLRDKLESAVQVVAAQDDLGDVHQMVWVPRLVIPADHFAAGVPSRELHLGGFVVDQYQDTAREYVGGALKALSRAGLTPWMHTSITEIRAAAALRIINGRACHVMTLREWGHLAWIVRYLGSELRGDLAGGIDPREPGTWEYYSDKAPYPTVHGHFGGSGPLAWSHNSIAAGIYDLLGNLPHEVDPGAGAMSYGCLRVQLLGYLHYAIDDADADFVIQDPRGFLQNEPSAAFAGWPLSGGLVRIQNELIAYGSLVLDPVISGQATLINCVRGAYNSSAAAHEPNLAYLEAYHCLVPGGYTCEVDSLGLADTDPGNATVAWAWGRYEHGSHDAAPAAGDVLSGGIEDLLVVSVDGQSMVVTRGYNGTGIGPMTFGDRLVKYSPSMDRIGPQRQAAFATGAVRTHEHLEDLFIPAGVTTDEPNGDHVLVYMDLGPGGIGGAKVLRGAGFDAGVGTSLLQWVMPEPGAYPTAHKGFRCAWTPVDIMRGP